LNVVNRYGLPLPIVSNQKTNAGLKELCQLAGFTETVTVATQKGTERLETTHQKWELVSTHTARRTFATVARERGTQLDTVRQMLGHTNTKQTEQYIKHTTENQLAEARKIWN